MKQRDVHPSLTESKIESYSRNDRFVQDSFAALRPLATHKPGSDESKSEARTQRKYVP